MYAGTPHLAWKTTDGGDTWKSIRSGMRDDSDVFSIVVDGKQPARVFAGACSGIYKSLDGGATWVKLSGARGASYRTYFVTQHPAHRNILYAGTTSGLIQSLDGGTSWSKLSAHVARGMAFDWSRPGRMFVATEDAGVLRSDDGGGHFVEVNQGLCSRHMSTLVESNGYLLSSVLGEKTRRGAMKLTATGSRWEDIAGADALPEIREVAPVPGHPEQVYAITGGSLVRSQDAGRTWIRVDVPWRPTSLIATAEIQGVLAASEAGLFRSTDGGQTWGRIDLPVSREPIRKLIALSPPAIAALAGSRVLLSTDGLRWKIARELPGNPDVWGLAGGEAGGLLAATSSGLMRSDDFGGAWRATGGGLGSTGIQAIVRDPTRDGAYFAAVSGAVYESVDEGESWKAIVAQEPGIDRIIQLLPAERGLLALTEARGVFALESSAPSAGTAARIRAKY
jgi:photosystem II stability/assembly factor-like uncharacterized protein